MKILKFNGQLSQIMGEQARINWETKLGLKFHSGHQAENGEITLMEVIDEEKAFSYLNHPMVEEITVAQANQLISERMDKTVYKVTSESIMAANLNSKVANSSIDLELMSPDWDEQQELEFLYNSGISGIKKTIVNVEKFVE